MIGLYFHSFQPNGRTLWQGRITSQVEPGFYIVQLFNWTGDSPSKFILVRIEDMLGWNFYESREAMRQQYELTHKINDARIDHRFD